jgi:DNA-binding MarR family transcriptional regulator
MRKHKIWPSDGQKLLPFDCFDQARGAPESTPHSEENAEAARPGHEELPKASLLNTTLPGASYGSSRSSRRAAKAQSPPVSIEPVYLLVKTLNAAEQRVLDSDRDGKSLKRPELRVLEQLVKTPHHSVRSLAVCLNLNQGTCSRAVDQLREKGLAEKFEDGKSKEFRFHIRPTPEGHRLYGEVRDALVTAIRELDAKTSGSITSALTSMQEVISGKDNAGVLEKTPQSRVRHERKAHPAAS